MYKKYTLFIIICAMVVSSSLVFGQEKGVNLYEQKATSYSVSPSMNDKGDVVSLPACISPNIDEHYKLAVSYMHKMGEEYKVIRSSAREIGHCNNMNYISTAFDVEILDNSFGEIPLFLFSVPAGIVIVDGETQKVSFRKNDIEKPIVTEKPLPTETPDITIPACAHPDKERHWQLVVEYISRQGEDSVRVDQASARLIGKCNGGITLSTQYDVYGPSTYPIVSSSDHIIPSNDLVFIGVITVDGETEQVSFDPIIKRTAIGEPNTGEKKTLRVQYQTSSEGIDSYQRSSDLILEPTFDKKRTLLKETFDINEGVVSEGNISEESPINQYTSIVETEEVINIREDKLFIKDREIKVLPSQALSIMGERMDISKDIVELKEINNRAVYEVISEKNAKILGLFPATLRTRIVVDAEDATTQFERPWWSFLAF